MLPGQRVNYDSIAPVYDEPTRDYTVDPHLVQFVTERGGTAGLRVLDMGCGTGKQLAANRRQFPDLALVGLDLFRGMLDVARFRAPSVTWVQGDSACAPFPDASFDYITNQFSYPHVQDKPGLFRETARLLRPGGRFVLTNLDPWAMPNWILYRYFPAARERDRRDFLPAEDIAARLSAVGLANVQVRRQRRDGDEELGKFLAYASQRFRASQLLVISDADYQAGLTRLGHDLTRLGADARVPSQFCFVTVTADRVG